jgi:drug/metabolite transporter (DMT)-like permease
MMPRSFEELAVFAAPAVFVILWSSGFIGAKFGLPYAEPLTFLAARFIAVVLLLGVLIAITRPPWPNRTALAHSAATGVLMHALYLSGVFVSIHEGMPTGITALIVGLQPLLTSTIANRWLGEPVAARQWLGLALGLVGVLLIVQGKTVGGDASLLGWAAAFWGLLGITLGTIYQRRFGAGIDWRPGFLVQYAAAAVFCLTGAYLFESRIIQWTPEFIFALGWLVFVLSFSAIWLLYFLIRRAAAARVVSLFYLTPPVTALMAWMLFNERLDALALLGMTICVAGVFLVNWRVGQAQRT